MSFVSGGAVDCGPSTALKDVGKLVERDYGVQRDRFVSSPNPAAGPSAPSYSCTDKKFRSRPAPGPGAQPASSSFDLAQLRSHLPQQQQQGPGIAPHVHAPLSGGQAVAGPASGQWAEQFPATAKGKGRAAEWGSEFDSSRSSPLRTATPQQAPTVAPWARPAAAPMMAMGGPMAMGAMPMQAAMPMQSSMPMPMYQQPPPQVMRPVPPEPQQVQPQAQAPVQAQAQESQESTVAPEDRPQDELARTAQALVDQLAEEQLPTNEKLKESQFVRLLRGLGDGSVVVQEPTDKTIPEGQEVGEGAKFVTSSGVDWASAFLDDAGVAETAATASNTTTQAERPGWVTPPYEIHPATMDGPADQWTHNFQDALTLADGVTVTDGMSYQQQHRKSVHFDEEQARSSVPRNLDEARASSTTMPGGASAWEEAFDTDAMSDFDTDALLEFSGPRKAVQDPVYGASSHEGWGGLQHDWDQWERPEEPAPYLFHTQNPYTLGSPIMREMSPTTMGVLELEAAVQQDPRDASAWLALGLKQQENEREDAAIRALAHATQLAPDTRAAYLALAVSYTNEGKEANALQSLERWIELGNPNMPPSETEYETREERVTRIIDMLIDIARQNPHDLDVDVQVALGVLFNANEDYHKAEDCFTAALEARPDDWVLYNRLGATLANSGRSHEAIKHYQRALALHPHFVRAQFNLGISYINLAQYRLAAQCILDAIRLQHADVTEGYGAGAENQVKGVTSEALWTTLRMACLHLQRPDLVTLANHHDLSGFPLTL